MRIKRAIYPLAVLVACFILLAVLAHRIDQAVSTSVLEQRQRVVVLDAGHGGEDSGAIGISGVLEKDINLSVVLKLRDMLTLGGYKVVLTREEDRSIHDPGTEKKGERKISDMNNRLELIQEQPSPVLISVHQNQFTQEQYSGAQMFYSETNPNNQTFADIMQRKFVAFLQPGNTREIKPSGPELFLLYNTQSPSLLVECGFLSNAEECALLSGEEYQCKVAFTIFAGLSEFLMKTEGGDAGNDQSVPEPSSSQTEILPDASENAPGNDNAADTLTSAP